MACSPPSAFAPRTTVIETVGRAVNLSDVPSAHCTRRLIQADAAQLFYLIFTPSLFVASGGGAYDNRTVAPSGYPRLPSA